MKRSAIYRTCDDEEWIEGRSKEIRRNNQDGATNRYVSSADIYRASEVSFLISLKPFRNVRATISRDMQECRMDPDLWTQRYLRKDQQRFFQSTSTQALQREWPNRGPRRCFQGWVWPLLKKNSKPVESASQGAPRYERGSITRSRSNFWSWSLACSITTNMCSVTMSSCGLIKKP